MTEIIFIGFVFGFIWFLWLTFTVFRMLRHYRRLVKIEKGDLKEILEKILSEANVSRERIEELKKECQVLRKEGLAHIQKIGLLRFNPFDNTGGKQSFVLAVLDGENNGIVINSLHSRSGTRWYAKTVKNGKGKDFELSNEEKRAVETAK